MPFVRRLPASKPSARTLWLGLASFLALAPLTVLGQQYTIEIKRAGFLNLGPAFQYERGLRYEYRITFPEGSAQRTLWVLVDLDGKLSWGQIPTSPGAKTITVESLQRSPEGMPLGSHNLTFTLFDERGPESPPGYLSGKVSVPAGWTPRATATVSFTIYSLDIPANRTDGVWLSSTPPGAEAYLAPAASARRSDGRPDLSKVLDPRYYVGGTPVFVSTPPGDYVVAFVLPTNERLKLAADDDFAQMVASEDGKVVSMGRGYELTREPGKLATCIGLFQVQQKPLSEAFLWLPPTPVYKFGADSLRSALTKQAVPSETIEQVISILPKTGKVSVTLGNKTLVVEVNAQGWSITVFSGN